MGLLKNTLRKTFITFIFIFAHYLFSHAQSRILKGTITDAHSAERIPFASMRFKKSGTGKLSDSAGNFSFRFSEWPAHDTLEITYVGYRDYELPADSLVNSNANNSITVSIKLERGKYINEVVVERKIDRGLLLWKKIVRRKKFNDRYRFSNFSYELYNKLELDLNKVNKEKLQEKKIFKPFKFVFDNIDTTEGPAFLP